MFGLQIEWAMLFNWIISGVIGFIFGILGAMYKHRLDKERDDLAWKRQLEELNKEWEYERSEKERFATREKLMDGVNDKNIKIVKLSRGKDLPPAAWSDLPSPPSNDFEEVEIDASTLTYLVFEEVDTENESGTSEQS